MAEAYLVEAVRTPIGRRNGGLSTIHSADLGAHVLKGLVERSGVDPNAVDDVVFGCCDTIGSQAGDIARSCWLAADLPLHVPGVTIDRQCGSSQQSVHFAAQAVMSGTADLVVAGGVQNMSAIPISSAMTVGEQFGFETPFTGSVGWEARFGDQEISQFNGAEMMVKKWDIKREELDNLAINSQSARAPASTPTDVHAAEIPRAHRRLRGQGGAGRREALRQRVLARCRRPPARRRRCRTPETRMPASAASRSHHK